MSAGVDDFRAVGKVTKINGKTVVFAPENTNYELQLELQSDAPEANARVEGRIRLTGRKVWSIPSGGNFITPIFGPPKIVQGRILFLDDAKMVVHAGTNIIIELPRNDHAYDLASGPLAVGGLVNVTTMPGGGFAVSKSAAAVK